MLAQALETCQPLIEIKHHLLTLDLARPLPAIEADPVRLEQMLFNLLNNACKCTPMGGVIKVLVFREGAEVVLSIRDNGEGMPPEVLAHSFDLFFQAEHELNFPDTGLGIGLSLVRQLAQLHGGSIVAKSDGPGTGSEFILRLPAQESITPLPKPELFIEQDLDAQRKHVIIIDDDSNVRTICRMLLEALNYKVTVVATGTEGIERAKELRPQIALIDLGMPGLSGFEVAARIRDELDHAIHLVAHTGFSREDDVTRAKAAGFDRYLVKSGDPRELLRVLQEIKL